MFGAIIGDIVGSRFEFDNCKSKEFELFTNTCDYTDDTVMTLAVAKALLLYGTITDMDAFKRELVRVMHEVGMLHPYCGYGGRFCTWMMKNDTEPYGSFGNGSAMRVSPVAWFAGSLDACEKLAAATAEVTHNHPEGIKGAVVVAGAIYLARMGRSMAEIREYASGSIPSILPWMRSGRTTISWKPVKAPFRRRWNRSLNPPASRTPSAMPFPSAATATPLPIWPAPSQRPTTVQTRR